MAHRTWTFRLEDGDHMVHLDHNLWTGKRTVLVDGRVLVDESKMLNLVSDYPFNMDGHQGVVKLRSNGLTYDYDVAIDGKSVTTGKPSVPAIPMPVWGWLFIIACALIPIVALGGIFPAIIGVVSAVICSVVARDPSREVSTRIGMCLGVTLFAWIIFFGFALAVGSLLGSS